MEVPFKIFNLVCCLVIPYYYHELISFGTIGFHSQFQTISPCGKMRKYISYFIMQEKDNTNQNRVFCWSFVYKEVNNSLVLSKGLDPFNQNFGVKLNGLARSKWKVSKKTLVGQPLRWTTFLSWIGTIKNGRSIWPFWPILDPSTSLFVTCHQFYSYIHAYVQ